MGENGALTHGSAAYGSEASAITLNNHERRKARCDSRGRADLGEPKPHCQCGSAWQARSCLAGVQPEDSRALEQAQVSQQQQMLKQKQRDEKTDAAKISRLVK